VSEKDYARLDKKDDGRVLCCRPRCSGVLAEVDEWRTTLRFPVGSTNAGTGIWRLARHAREGVKRGYRASYARPFERLDCGCMVGVIRDHEISSGDLPARAVCPRCGSESTLDASRLQLSPAPPIAGLGPVVAESGGYVHVGLGGPGSTWQRHRCGR
jgi:hypothetical protein